MATEAMTASDARLVLGVSAPYDRQALRLAYKAQARRWHPDVAKTKGIGFDEANARMAGINVAYALLLSELDSMPEGRMPSPSPAWDSPMAPHAPAATPRKAEPTMTEEEAAEYRRGHAEDFDAFEKWVRSWDASDAEKGDARAAHAAGMFPDQKVQEDMLEWSYGRSRYARKWLHANHGSFFPWPWAIQKHRSEIFAGLDRMQGKASYRRGSDGRWHSPNVGNPDDMPRNGERPHRQVPQVAQLLLFAVACAFGVILVRDYGASGIAGCALAFMLVRTAVAVWLERRKTVEWRTWHQVAAVPVLCLVAWGIAAGLAASGLFGGAAALFEHLHSI